MKCLSLLFFLWPVFVSAQKIKSSQLDAVRNRWRIESFPVGLKESGENRVNAAFKSVGDSLFLQLAGSGSGANTVLFGDRLILLLDDDSTVTLTSSTLQSADRGGYAYQYFLSQQDLAQLSRHNLQALRKYSTEGYDDIYLDKQNAGHLRELSLVFGDELKKTSVFKAGQASLPPGFPGGRDVLLRFFNRNLKPLGGLQPGERKFLLAQFTVSADGTIGDIAIKHPAGDPFDNEALRILQRMPHWKPAKEGGLPVETTWQQPLTFIREESGLQIRF